MAVLTGNPNCGKTPLFNALTRLRAKVGNYAVIFCGLQARPGIAWTEAPERSIGAEAQMTWNKRRKG